MVMDGAYDDAEAYDLLRGMGVKPIIKPGRNARSDMGPPLKEVGVDVIIFREGWRNGSRAYHNVRQFYLELTRIRNSRQNQE